MPVETLESLRVLSNLESDKQKFLQIVLAGQPELDDKLARYELRQLNQRMAVRTKIRNLTPIEALAYIDFRLEKAAGGRIEVFTHDALDYIVGKAQGNPRRLNIFCDNALVNGMGYRAPVVTREIAQEAIEPHLSEHERATHATLPPWMTPLAERAPRRRYAAMAAVAVAVVALYLGLGTDLLSHNAPQRYAHETPPRETQVATLPKSDRDIPDIAPAAASSNTTTAPPIAAAAPETARYVIETQDTLQQLCLLAYGICGKDMVLALAKANPTVDPDHLVAGQMVYLPVIENLKPVVP